MQKMEIMKILLLSTVATFNLCVPIVSDELAKWDLCSFYLVGAVGDGGGPWQFTFVT